MLPPSTEIVPEASIVIAPPSPSAFPSPRVLASTTLPCVRERLLVVILISPEFSTEFGVPAKVLALTLPPLVRVTLALSIPSGKLKLPSALMPISPAVDNPPNSALPAGAKIIPPSKSTLPPNRAIVSPVATCKLAPD